MKQITIIIFLFTFTLSSLASVRPQEVLKQSDLISYHPELKGLKDLQVDISSPSITQQLKDQLIFGKVRSVSFRVYWEYPDKIDVQVLGLPEGFHEIKDGLRRMMAGYVEFIIPNQLEPRFEGYKLVGSNENALKKIVAKDSSLSKPISQYELVFNSSNELVEMLAMKKVGKQTSKFTGSRKSWSDNKWVLDVVEVKSVERGTITKLTQNLEYEKVAGYGVPKTLRVHTEQTVGVAEAMKSKLTEEQKKNLNREFSSIIYFKNYEINAGKAKKWFTKNYSLEQKK